VARTRPALSAVVALLFLAVPARPALAGGEFDPAFGVGGVASAPISGHTHAQDVAVQPDGRIVAVGAAPSYVGYTYTHPVIARFLPNGAMDPSFGVGGVVHTEVLDEIYAVALQPDGKIVVVGPKGVLTVSAARFLPGGTLDVSFGHGGVASIALGQGGPKSEAGHAVYDPWYVSDVVVQPGGGIVLGGSALGWSLYRDEVFALFRLTPSGEEDTTFSKTGMAVLPEFPGRIEAVALAPGGKIVGAGETETDPRADGKGRISFGVARWGPNGNRDVKFGKLGHVRSGFGNGMSSEPHGVAVSPDGRIAVAGDVWPLDDVIPVRRYQVAMARYLPDGTRDLAFDGDGLSTNAFGGSQAFATDVAIDATGRTIVAGFRRTSLEGHWLVVGRFLPDGSPDATFGAGGAVTTRVGGDDSVITSIALDAAGGILASTGRGLPYGPSEFGVLRLLP
jgi:uncharacterized delta-60 repeat protein